jgi:hypothetical protein
MRRALTAWARRVERRPNSGASAAFAHPMARRRSPKNWRRPGALPRRASPSLISRPVSRVLCGAGCEPARDGHSSGAPVARRFKQPTRTAGSGHRSWNAAAACAASVLHAVPIWFCSRWGLPCRLRCHRRGALLPHRFTLAAGALPGGGRCGGLFSVALSLRSPPPDVIRHRMSMEPGLSSPPRGAKRPSGRLMTKEWGAPAVASRGISTPREAVS